MTLDEGPAGPPRGMTTPVGVGTVPTDEARSVPKWKAAVTEYVPGSCGAFTVQVTLPSANFFAVRSVFWSKMTALLMFFLRPAARLSTHLVCSWPSPAQIFGAPTITQPSPFSGLA